MRKLDVLTIGLVILLGGGALYGVFQVVGVDTQQSGIWAGAGLMALLLGWTATYLNRFFTGKMSLNEQTEFYRTKAYEKRLKTMTPEEYEAFTAALEADGIEVED